MAVESRINADDEWFVGEDREWRFRFVAGDVDDVAEWTMQLAFYSRRARDTDPPLVVVPASGVPASAVNGVVTPAYAVAVVSAAETMTLRAGIFQFVLRRTDVGKRAVLSYGPAELRSAVSA